MRTHSKRTYAAVVMAMMVVSARPVGRKPNQAAGPMRACDGAKAPKAAVAAKPAPAAAPAKPAAAPKAGGEHRSLLPTEERRRRLRRWLGQSACLRPLLLRLLLAKAVRGCDQRRNGARSFSSSPRSLKKLATELEAQRARHQGTAGQDQVPRDQGHGALGSAAAAAKPPPPPAITVDTGGIKLRVSGLFQGLVHRERRGVVDTFRLRRAELKFSGDISPRIKWAVMVDPAKALSLSTTTSSMGGQTVVTGTSISQSGRMMQDAFVSLNWKPAFSIEVGQQKVPLGMEGTASPASSTSSSARCS